MKETTGLSLKLFDGTDKFDYRVLNENWGKVEDGLKDVENDLATLTGDLESVANDLAIVESDLSTVKSDLSAVKYPDMTYALSEYATPERYNNKVVYAMRFAFAPGGGSTEVNDRIPANVTIVSIDGVGFRNTNGVTTYRPLWSIPGLSIYYNKEEGKLYTETSDEYNILLASQIYLTVKYVK